MNVEILETLDTRQTTFLNIMVEKESRTPIMYVIPGDPYWWPERYEMDDVDFIQIEIPPQTDEPIDESFDQQLPDMRDCKKCKGGIAFKTTTCCSERSAGFRSKWVCNECKHTSYSRKG